MIIIIRVISIAPYLTNRAEHTVLYKININIYIKNLKTTTTNFVCVSACVRACLPACMPACVCFSVTL